MERIIELISKDNRSLYKIAKDAGVDYALLHRIVTRKTKKHIWLDTAFKLADALGVDVNEFRKE